MTRRNQVFSLAFAASLLAGPALFAQGAARGPLAAQVGARRITLDEVDKKVEQRVFQQLFDARKATLDEMVAEQLLADEAKAKGVAVDKLVAAEITAKTKAVSDEEVQAFYDQNKAQMGGQPFDQIKGRIRPFLESQNQTAVRKTYIDALRKKAGVRTFLDPPRTQVAVSPDDPAKGPANAPVQIVIFSEFQCPFCSKVVPTFKKVEEAYGDKLHVVFRNFPLPMHQQAPGAANAGECAREQGKFWEYHDKLFANQTALQVADLKKYAGELKLDQAKFDACVDTNKYADAVKKDQDAGQAAGVTGTPTFFINGRAISGAQPLEAFKAVIDEELEHKGGAAAK